MANKETSYKKDSSNKKIFVVREFEAPINKVWKAWTDPVILDKWWAPKPWMATTTSMDFREGGTWLYYMQGPDGSRHYSKLDYHVIDEPNRFTGSDGFCDEKGNSIDTMPSSNWIVSFKPSGDDTRVEIEITFQSEKDLIALVEMGFEEGFAAGHRNLDEVLANQ